jgi:hypothetical protein
VSFARIIDTTGTVGLDGLFRARCHDCHVDLPKLAAECAEHPLAGRDLAVVLAAGLTPDDAAAVEAQMLATVWDIPTEPASDDAPGGARA